MRGKITRRTAALAALALLPALVVAAGTDTAGAITSTPSGPETLPAVDTPMWQVNGAVWATVVSKGVLYVGGDFDKIRPPDAPAGTGEITMARVAAFHASGDFAGQPCATATPCPGIGVWNNPGVTGGRVYALGITPDGNTLYVGGDLTTVKSSPRAKAAAINLTPGTNPNSRTLPWNPGFNGSVRSIAATDTTTYFGGAFSSAAGGQARGQLAAFDRATGVLTPWAPKLTASAKGTRVSALLIAPNDTGRVVLGGMFSRVNDEAHYGIAQVDGATGLVNGPMSDSVIRFSSSGTSEVKSLVTDGINIYAGAEGDGPSVFDGTASADPSTGALLWQTDCHGATQAVAVLGGALYVGSHAHDCTTPPIPGGGFPQAPFLAGANSWHHLMAERAVGGGTTAPGGGLLTWYPQANPGPTNGVTANELGPRAMATDGTNLFVGGQSTTMNGRPQQGIAMFQPGGSGAAPGTPKVSVTTAGGKATVRWIGTSDNDDSKLTYRVLKDGVEVYSTGPVTYPFWKAPTFVWRDAGTPGTNYTVGVTDEAGLTKSRTATAGPGGYSALVLADKPLLYWRLNQTPGQPAADSSGGNRTGTFRGVYSYRKADALGTDYAATQGNTTATMITQNGTAAAAPANFTMEMWFRSSGSGGRLMGFSPAGTTASTAPNRVLYMTNPGQLIYSVRNADNSTCQTGSDKYWVAGQCYVWTQQAYNDGTWHHVVVTQSSTAGIAIYVDGVREGATTGGGNPKAMTGVWRVGADGLSNVPRKPGPSVVPGDIDEVAVYPTVLTPAQIAAHYAAAE